MGQALLRLLPLQEGQQQECLSGQDRLPDGTSADREYHIIALKNTCLKQLWSGSNINGARSDFGHRQSARIALCP